MLWYLVEHWFFCHHIWFSAGCVSVQQMCVASIWLLAMNKTHSFLGYATFFYDWNVYFSSFFGKNIVDGGVTVYEWREETVFIFTFLNLCWPKKSLTQQVICHVLMKKPKQLSIKCRLSLLFLHYLITSYHSYHPLTFPSEVLFTFHKIFPENFRAFINKNRTKEREKMWKF